MPVGCRNELQRHILVQDQRPVIGGVGGNIDPAGAIEILPSALRRSGAVANNGHAKEAVGLAASAGIGAGRLIAADLVAAIVEIWAEQTVDSAGGAGWRRVLDSVLGNGRHGGIAAATNRLGYRRIIGRSHNEGDVALGDQRRLAAIAADAVGIAVRGGRCGVWRDAGVATVIDRDIERETAVPVFCARIACDVGQVDHGGVQGAVDGRQRAGERKRFSAIRGKRKAIRQCDGHCKHISCLRILVGNRQAIQRDGSLTCRFNRFERRCIALVHATYADLRRVVDRRHKNIAGGADNVIDLRGAVLEVGHLTRIDSEVVLGADGLRRIDAILVLHAAVGLAGNQAAVGIAQAVVNDHFDTISGIDVGVDSVVEAYLQAIEIGLDVGQRAAQLQRTGNATERAVDCDASHAIGAAKIDAERLIGRQRQWIAPVVEQAHGHCDTAVGFARAVAIFGVQVDDAEGADAGPATGIDRHIAGGRSDGWRVIDGGDDNADGLDDAAVFHAASTDVAADCRAAFGRLPDIRGTFLERDRQRHIARCGAVGVMIDISGAGVENTLACSVRCQQRIECSHATGQRQAAGAAATDSNAGRQVQCRQRAAANTKSDLNAGTEGSRLGVAKHDAVQPGRHIFRHHVVRWQQEGGRLVNRGDPDFRAGNGQVEAALQSGSLLRVPVVGVCIDRRSAGRHMVECAPIGDHASATVLVGCAGRVEPVIGNHLQHVFGVQVSTRPYRQGGQRTVDICHRACQQQITVGDASAADNAAHTVHLQRDIARRAGPYDRLAAAVDYAHDHGNLVNFAWIERFEIRVAQHKARSFIIVGSNAIDQDRRAGFAGKDRRIIAWLELDLENRWC